MSHGFAPHFSSHSLSLVYQSSIELGFSSGRRRSAHYPRTLPSNFNDSTVGLRSFEIHGRSLVSGPSSVASEPPSILIFAARRSSFVKIPGLHMARYMGSSLHLQSRYFLHDVRVVRLPRHGARAQALIQTVRFYCLGNRCDTSRNPSMFAAFEVLPVQLELESHVRQTGKQRRARDWLL